MEQYQEIYEETNNIEEDEIPENIYNNQAEFHLVKENYHNKNKANYDNARYILSKNQFENNAQQRLNDFYNYYTESNIINNENEEFPLNQRINTSTSERIINNYNSNLRDQYSYPFNNRVNIRKKVYKGNTPQPFIINNIIYGSPNDDYIDNYQYYETKNIKNIGNKKFDSITHITGYSNLIPLNKNKSPNRNNNYINDNRREYDDFMRKYNSKSDQNYLMRQKQLRREEEIRLEKIKQERIREERKRQEEELKLEKLRNEELREERLRKERLRQERYTYAGKYPNDKDNVNRQKIIKKTKIKKYNKNPYKNNAHNFSYINNNNKYNDFYSSKRNTSSEILNNRNRIINSYRRRIRSDIFDNKNISGYSSRNKKKLMNFYKVKQKTASLNFPSQNRKVDTYGENFDKEKYKREYVNIENDEDGIIENHIETGISKDGQYLVSVSSARKIFDENNENENNYQDENEEEEIYEKIEETNEDNNNNKFYELPEKDVEEIISTKIEKKRNLGDNYRYYERRILNSPIITSFTKHKRRTGRRTIYGNEEHETREVKRYTIRPQINEFGEKTNRMIESNIPYEEEKEGQINNVNYSGEGDKEALYDNEEEEHYIEEEAYYK